MIRFWGQLPGQDEAGWNTVNNVNQVPANVNELQIDNKPMIRVSSVGSQHGEIPPYLDAADKARFAAALAQGQGDWMAAEGAPDNAQKYANLTNRGGSMIGNFLDSYMNNPLAVAGTVFGGLGLAGAGPLAGLSNAGSALSKLFSSLGEAGGTAGSAAGSVAGGLPANYWSMLADAGGAASDAGAVGAGTFGGEAGLGFNTMNPGLSAGLGLSESEAASISSLFPQGLTPEIAQGLGLSASEAASINAAINGGSAAVNGPLFIPDGQVANLANSGGPNIPGTPSTPTTIPSGTQNALQRFLDGTANGADIAKLLGTLGSTALGFLGGNAQSNALKDITSQQIEANNAMQDKWLALGAPSRARLEGSYAPGFDLAASDPGFQNALDTSANTAARSYSAKAGNPQDSPGSQAEILKYVLGTTYLPQLNTYRSQNATSGQLGTNVAGTAGLNAANAYGGTAALQGAQNATSPYSALASGLGALTAPDNSLSSLLQQLKNAGININTGNVPA